MFDNFISLKIKMLYTGASSFFHFTTVKPKRFTLYLPYVGCIFFGTGVGKGQG